MASIKKVKSPPAPKPDNQLQLNWDYLIQRVDNLLKIAAEQELRIDRLADKLEPRMVPNYDKAEFGAARRPALKWIEREPQSIMWTIYVDPTRLILTPGTTLRYDIDRKCVTTYDGVTIGHLSDDDHGVIAGPVLMGAKLHVYLTTSRKLGIKLGRPA